MISILCPTCTEGWLMKTERQSVIKSIREYIPLTDCLIDFDENPLRFEHIFSRFRHVCRYTIWKS